MCEEKSLSSIPKDNEKLLFEIGTPIVGEFVAGLSFKDQLVSTDRVHSTIEKRLKDFSVSGVERGFLCFHTIQTKYGQEEFAKFHFVGIMKSIALELGLEMDKNILC